MYSRRRALTLAAVGIGALSGCTELASGDGPITRSAAPAEVEDAVLDETGHELEDQREETLSREFEVGGQVRQVEATNYATIYTRAVGESGTQGSLFAVVSTPAFNFAGQSFNPVASASNEEILEFVAGQFGGLNDTESVSQSTQTVLGTETTITKFGAEASFNGERIPVYIHVGSVEDGDDIVIGAGAYPQALEGSEEAAIAQLFGGIEHGSE